MSNSNTQEIIADPEISFIEVALELDPFGEVSRRELYQEYVRWAAKEGIPAVSTQAFNKTLVQTFGSHVRTFKTRRGGFQMGIWKGICFKPDYQRLPTEGS